jgi:hypothetical protein
MLVAMGAAATKEEARQVLEESGSNIDQASSNIFVGSHVSYLSHYDIMTHSHFNT